MFSFLDESVSEINSKIRKNGSFILRFIEARMWHDSLESNRNYLRISSMYHIQYADKTYYAIAYSVIENDHVKGVGVAFNEKVETRFLKIPSLGYQAKMTPTNLGASIVGLLGGILISLIRAC